MQTVTPSSLAAELTAAAPRLEEHEHRLAVGLYRLLAQGSPVEAGSLAKAIVPFEKGGVNMTWIESFPIPQCEGHYLFFVELDGHFTDTRVRKALAALEKKAVRLETLGSYPRSQPVG